MQASTATRFAGGIGKPPLSNDSAYCSALARSSSVTLMALPSYETSSLYEMKQYMIGLPSRRDSHGAPPLPRRPLLREPTQREQRLVVPGPAEGRQADDDR